MPEEHDAEPASEALVTSPPTHATSPKCKAKAKAKPKARNAKAKSKASTKKKKAPGKSPAKKNPSSPKQNTSPAKAKNSKRPDTKQTKPAREKSFARRWRPSGPQAAMKWEAIRNTFDRNLRARLNIPGKFED